MNWQELSQVAPTLAEIGRRRFEATHVALLGTVRRDGSPRISPVEPYFVRDHLLLGMLPDSHKARDLARDPRCAVHSSVSDVNGSEGEFKLDGVARDVTDPDLLHANPDTWWNAANASPATVVAIDIQRAAYVAWDTAKGTISVTLWSAERGVTTETRPY